MHTVELVEQALEAARRLGFRIRHDWLDGVTSGPCLISGQKWLFLDLNDSPSEHLAILRDALHREPGLASLDIQAELAAILDIRRIA